MKWKTEYFDANKRTTCCRNIFYSMTFFCRITLRCGTYKQAAFEAVRQGNLSLLQNLIQFGKVNVNEQERGFPGRTLLITSIENKKVEIFDYLLSLENINLDLPDKAGETPFRYSTDNEYFALELIRRGANPFYENRGYTLLHYLALIQCDESNLKVGQLLIEKGVNINARDPDGYTVLSCAAQDCKVDWVCMLLYYGADVTIPTKDLGLLPLFVIQWPSHCRRPENVDLLDHHSYRACSDIQFLQDILFDYTFDNFKNTITVENLIRAMGISSGLFYKTLEHISDVEFKTKPNEIIKYLSDVNGKDFKFLAEKYEFILKEIVDSVPIFSLLIRRRYNYKSLNLKMIIDVFLESEFVADFIQNSTFDSLTSPITSLIEKYGHKISLDEITTQILIMLSYGLEVRSEDLETVYVHHGHCPLFKFLLCMNIIKTDSSVDYSVPIDFLSILSMNHH